MLGYYGSGHNGLMIGRIGEGMQLDKVTLVLTTKETLHALIFTTIILVVYAVILWQAKKCGKEKAVCKWGNIISAFFAWTELVFGDFIQILESNGLKYALILVAVIVLVNNMVLSE